MELASTEDKLKSGYDTLLLGYAAGTLDEAQNIAVSTHLTFSQKANDFVHSCECIGGALIEEEMPAHAMNAGSLESVLDRLGEDANEARPSAVPVFAHDAIDFDIPAPLASPLHQCGQNFQWKTLFHGFQSFDFDLGCETSTARFLKADPGVKSPHHSHGGTEITLVLDGAFSDETGDYKVGDLIVTDESFDHAPVACARQGCVCFVVSTAPIKLKGIASLLNPFLKP